MKHALFNLRHRESGQIVSIFGANLDDFGGEFLIFTSEGWDSRPVEDFEPIKAEVLELEEA
jgi:hypothetical protein